MGSCPRAYSSALSYCLTEPHLLASSGLRPLLLPTQVLPLLSHPRDCMTSLCRDHSTLCPVLPMSCLHHTLNFISRWLSSFFLIHFVPSYLLCERHTTVIYARTSYTDHRVVICILDHYLHPVSITAQIQQAWVGVRARGKRITRLVLPSSLPGPSLSLSNSSGPVS